MANYASGVNPTLLRWARERAGYSLAQVAHSFRKQPEIVQQWESGEAAPTYNQLEKLAYTLYKRPIAVFFFPQPPEEPDPSQSFRTLPDSELANLLPDTRHAIRQAKARQIALRDLTDGQNPSERMILRDVRIHVRSDIVQAARTIREYLRVPLHEQVCWSSRTDEPVKKWRDAIQECGVFVFKRPFKQRDVSGFCLADEEFPLIYLNNSTAIARQVFTLFHELAHLLLHVSGVTKQNDRYIDVLVGDAREIEVFCNRLTAECLVPSDDFDRRLPSNLPLDQLVGDLSGHYKVSREVILRKLLDRHTVDRAYYERTVAGWLDDYSRKQQSGRKGGDYYATQAAYLGDKLLTLAFKRYYRGACTIEQLCEYFGVDCTNLEGLMGREGWAF